MEREAASVVTGVCVEKRVSVMQYRIQSESGEILRRRPPDDHVMF